MAQASSQSFDKDKYNLSLEKNGKPKKQLTSIIGSGTYGSIYKTRTPRLVAKVLTFDEEEEIKFCNDILETLRADENVNIHLPFFEDDYEFQSKIGSDDWKFKVVEKNKALQYMEELHPIRDKKPGTPLDDVEKKFVRDIINMLEYISDKHKCFFLDFKAANMMYRKTFKVRRKGSKIQKTEFMTPVLIDLDSLMRYDTTYKNSWWYSIVTTYHTFDMPYESYEIPTEITEEAFNNTCLYVQRVACLSMLVDWVMGRLRMHNLLAKYPNYALSGKTKHDYCFEALRLYFGVLNEVKEARDLLEIAEKQPPFNEPFGALTLPKHKKYGHFYTCRSSFVDRPLNL